MVVFQVSMMALSRRMGLMKILSPPLRSSACLPPRSPQGPTPRGSLCPHLDLPALQAQLVSGMQCNVCYLGFFSFCVCALLFNITAWYLRESSVLNGLVGMSTAACMTYMVLLHYGDTIWYDQCKSMKPYIVYLLIVLAARCTFMK